jgi:hypothetical protein
MGLQVNLMRPWRKMGEPQRGDGAFSNTPPPACCLSPALGTRETWEAGEGQWRGGKREPNESLDGLTGVGGGRGVGAQESWAHQDEDGWRRPRACGKMGPKVPSARASGPRGMHGGAGEMGTAASWLSMENDQRCCAGCGESRTHGAQRGLRHEVVSVMVVLDTMS